jgi:hypothetical protein
VGLRRRGTEGAPHDAKKEPKKERAA